MRPSKLLKDLKILITLFPCSLVLFLLLGVEFEGFVTIFSFTVGLSSFLMIDDLSSLSLLLLISDETILLKIYSVKCHPLWEFIEKNVYCHMTNKRFLGGVKYNPYPQTNMF